MAYQLVEFKDSIQAVEIKLDDPHTHDVTDGEFMTAINTILNLHHKTPVQHVLFEGPPGARTLVVELQDGRTSNWVFYDPEMKLYTLHIDGAAPWTQEEIFLLIPIRQNMIEIAAKHDFTESFEWTSL